MKVAYIRVSTVEQNEARQVEALKKYDVEKIFLDKISGKDTELSGSTQQKAHWIRDQRTEICHGTDSKEDQ